MTKTNRIAQRNKCMCSNMCMMRQKECCTLLCRMSKMGWSRHKEQRTQGFVCGGVWKASVFYNHYKRKEKRFRQNRKYARKWKEYERRFCLSCLSWCCLPHATGGRTISIRILLPVQTIAVKAACRKRKAARKKTAAVLTTAGRWMKNPKMKVLPIYSYRTAAVDSN